MRLLSCFPDFEIEATEVARDIIKLRSSNLASVVVLGRNRKLLAGAESALLSQGVSAVIAQRKDAFESTPFVWLHSILRLASDKQDIESLEAVCGTFFQLTQVEIEPEDIVAKDPTSNLGYLQHWVGSIRQKTPNALVEEIVDKISRCLIRGRDFRTFSRCALGWFDRLVQARQQTDGDPAIEVFTRYEEERSVWEDLMREITQSLGDEITLEAFLQELQMHSKEPTPKPNTVVLMTIHGAKGKEFDHVYLIGLVEDELPSFQSIQKGDNSPEMEEERRNCFVAITRTVETLTISYAKRYRGWAKEPSRFLFEMGLLNNK